MAEKRPDPDPRSAIDSLNIPTSQDDLRSLFLDFYRFHFEQDTTNPLPAFDALESIVGYWWNAGEEPKDGVVEVPFWALEIFVHGYHQYKDAHEHRKPLHFGEAFGIEGGGRGKQPRIRQHMVEWKDRNLALWIALDRERGTSREQAIANAAERVGVSEAAADKADRRYHADAKRQLERHRARST